MHTSMRFKYMYIAAIALCGFTMAAVRAGAQDTATAPATTKSMEFQDHIDAANLLMGSNPNLQGMRTLCIDLKAWGAFRKDLAAKQVVLPPTKAFDQLYYIGMNTVGTWALVTSDGIIQIDALHNSDEAEKIIVAGYKKLGLDPNQIKYVILTHSHAEHYGGGKYFQDTYHSHIIMGAADWDIIEKNPNPPPAKRDISLTETYKLTLGNTTVTIYPSPGHTPGTLNLLVPVTDHGKPHLMSYTGGTGIPKGMDAMLEYKESLARFTKAGEDTNVDGIISSHPWFDNTYTDGKTDKMTRLQNLKPGETNPWVVGQGEYVLSIMANMECLESSMARLKETGSQ